MCVLCDGNALVIIFFPDKALEYVKQTRPFMINDLEMDKVLKDRRKVYEMLESQQIDVPKHVFCNRDSSDAVDTNVIEEFDEVSASIFVCACCPRDYPLFLLIDSMWLLTACTLTSHWLKSLWTLRTTTSTFTIP